VKVTNCVQCCSSTTAVDASAQEALKLRAATSLRLPEFVAAGRVIYPNGTNAVDARVRIARDHHLDRRIEHRPVNGNASERESPNQLTYRHARRPHWIFDYEKYFGAKTGEYR
jgi:hypothetical protein